MEQFVILIIIYVLYAVFTNIMRKMKEQQRPSPPGQRPPAKPAQRPVAEAPPEVDIPPFLREMLGLDKPQPPQPEMVEDLEEPPAAMEEPPKPVMPAIPERIPASAKMEADEIEDLSQKFPSISIKTKNAVQELLEGNENLRNAFILKEILDAPVSRRARRFPFSGHP